MPKQPPINGRTTDDPLGKKLLAVLAEKGHPDDLNVLAEALGVTVQSTYDYIRHGRLSKDRYARLVAWSGRSLDWWFDVETKQSHQVAAEPVAAYNAWPVAGMTVEQLHRALTAEERAEVAGFIRGILAASSRGKRSAAA
jgi:hypothetical protein